MTSHRKTVKPKSGVESFLKDALEREKIQQNIEGAGWFEKRKALANPHPEDLETWFIGLERKGASDSAIFAQSIQPGRGGRPVVLVPGPGIHGAVEAPVTGGPGKSGSVRVGQPVAVVSGTGAEGRDPDAWVNPTGGIQRGRDRLGTGRYGASRDGGVRDHEGQDYTSTDSQKVVAPIAGRVTKVGYPYGDSTEYRFVEITDESTGRRVRVMYVSPDVEVGQAVAAGEEIGTYQSLQPRYPGITDHVHVEAWVDGQRVDPLEVIPALRP